MTLEEWKPLAEQGDADAQFSLGVMYRVGQGVPQDDAEAVKWYRKAAKQGHANAQNHLGYLYDCGRPVPQDDAEAAKRVRSVPTVEPEARRSKAAEAVKWYRKAAEQGLALAQFNLGVMYLNGKGVPQHYVQALMWFNLAEAQGEPHGQQARAFLAKKMIPDQIEEAHRLAREWKPRSSSSTGVDWTALGGLTPPPNTPVRRNLTTDRHRGASSRS